MGSPGRSSAWLLAGLAPLGLLASACGDRAPADPWPTQLATPTLVTGPSPFPAGCNPASPGEVLAVGAEVEPHLALDREDPHHLVAAWQQDRWSDGGANGLGTAASSDGGRTWARGLAPFTTCAGIGKAAGGFDRATDPWLAVAPGGAVVHLLGLAFDDPPSARRAMVASRSTDGGRHWSPLVALAADTDQDVALDKCTITADPGRPGLVYATWDRLAGLTGPPSGASGPAYLARSTDAGLTWEPAAVLHDPGLDAQTISSQIVVLPDGTLVDLLLLILEASRSAPTVQVAALRSTDAGLTWSAPVVVADWRSAGVFDPVGQRPVRGGDLVPSIAADAASGALYVTWQDGRFSGGAVEAIALSRSLDGGLTWSAPVRVNGDGGAPAFTAALAVARSGRVGVSYYDTRDAERWGPSLWAATRWLATSDDGGRTFSEEAVGGPFDLRRAPLAGGLFLGDYAGLAGGEDAFTALFSMTTDGAGPEGTDLFAWPPQP